MIRVEGGHSRIQDNFPGENLTVNLKPLFMETQANSIYRNGQKKSFLFDDNNEDDVTSDTRK